MLGVSTGSFPRMPTVTVERTYLQLLAPGAERAAPKPLADASIAEESPCSVETYRELYREVGRAYFWLDRLSWSDEVLATYLARPEVRIWILRDADGIGGYFELAMGTDRAVEVAYFGLVPSRHGRGLGRALLARAIDEGVGVGGVAHLATHLHARRPGRPPQLPRARLRPVQARDVRSRSPRRVTSASHPMWLRCRCHRGGVHGAGTDVRRRTPR
ncbi:MAG: GNAT family N-acetyltransferase [Gemmatimonadetes bacterium]|nr:GNAT family N-acetyltransferase [Gemmatimonadota bacterium]